MAFSISSRDRLWGGALPAATTPTTCHGRNRSGSLLPVISPANALSSLLVCDLKMKSFIGLSPLQVRSSDDARRRRPRASATFRALFRRRQQAFALRLLACELAGTAHRLRPLP